MCLAASPPILFLGTTLFSADPTDLLFRAVDRALRHVCVSHHRYVRPRTSPPAAGRANAGRANVVPFTKLDCRHRLQASRARGADRPRHRGLRLHARRGVVADQRAGGVVGGHGRFRLSLPPSEYRGGLRWAVVIEGVKRRRRQVPRPNRPSALPHRRALPARARRRGRQRRPVQAAWPRAWVAGRRSGRCVHVVPTSAREKHALSCTQLDSAAFTVFLSGVITRCTEVPSSRPDVGIFTT